MNSDPGMLYSIAIHLSPTRPGTVPATVGHLAHAAFLNTVREADEALAEVLHSPHLPLRPFTVSPLLGVGEARDRQVRVLPEETYTLRFTILYEPIFHHFMRRFLRGDRPALRLGQTLFLIKEILATPEASPHAGYTTFDELWRWGGEAAGKPLIDLEFLSPTAFSFGDGPGGKRFYVLPDARLVFRSLATTWSAFAPAAYPIDPDAVELYVDEHVVVQRLRDVHTQMLDYGRYKQVGFQGRVTYRQMDQSEHAAEWRQALKALAGFAWYAGVGYKTTQGMGQVGQAAGEMQPGGCRPGRECLKDGK